jgi:adenine-specific DNA-methyltransferase
VRDSALDLTKIMLEQIKISLNSFSHGNLSDNALNLFQTLGYESDRQQPFDDKSFANFAEYITHESNFNQKNAFADEWQYVDLLFQLTETELTQQFSMFDSKDIEREQFNSYLFFAVELNQTKSDGRNFTRTDLANITREINKCFPMPVFVLFKIGQNLTQSAIA